MKRPLLRQGGILLFTMAITLAPAVTCAEIQVRVSFKVIRGPNGEFPDNSNTIGVTGLNLNSEQVIRDNITFTNGMLRRRGSPIRLFLRDNTVYDVTGQASPWFTQTARSSANKNALEAAATASAAARAAWSWHDDSINVYLNNTRSGVCSLPSSGRSAIFIGAGAYQELLIHEIGHFFNLVHTHAGDNDGDCDDWADGDGFAETLDDDPDATAADINARYAGETQEKRDDLIFNIMSYHLPQDRLVWAQTQEFVETANSERGAQVSGKGFFVRGDGNDFNDGTTYGSRVRTLQRAVGLSSSSNDVLLIRGAVDVPDGTVFSKPQVWMKWRSKALIE